MIVHFLISQAGVFMGFSITSAVFGGTIIICYSIAIATYRDDYYRDYSYGYGYYGRYRHRSYDAEMALSAIILILGIVEFVIGIWAAVCVCVMNPCCTNTPPQQVSPPPPLHKSDQSRGGGGGGAKVTALLLKFL